MRTSVCGAPCAAEESRAWRGEWHSRAPLSVGLYWQVTPLCSSEGKEQRLVQICSRKDGTVERKDIMAAMYARAEEGLLHSADSKIEAARRAEEVAALRRLIAETEAEVVAVHRSAAADCGRKLSAAEMTVHAALGPLLEKSRQLRAKLKRMDRS
jgi:hypothetical protein